SAWDPPGTGLAIRSVVGFDRDMAARMLRLNEGRPDPKATWANLTRSERKRAERLWNLELGPDELRVTRQGRPPVIDAALVVYLTRVICEANGRRKFRFSRSVFGAPDGPMWRALIQALPLAQSFLARLATPPLTHPKISKHAETVAEIVSVIRS